VTVVEEMECYTCLSVRGERRISPGQPVFRGQWWDVEHAYPCGMVGWMVLVLKRHAEALHELSGEEFAELGPLIERTARALREELGCKKEYLACFSEAAHFSYVHVHVVARAEEWPDELRSRGVFKMLKVDGPDVVPPEQVIEFCTRMEQYYR
jgi:diadenosine tetraphosphate (Ap4A) HIT family hydrolase